MTQSPAMNKEEKVIPDFNSNPKINWQNIFRFVFVFIKYDLYFCFVNIK